MKKFNLMQILPSLQSGGVEQGTIDVANFLASLEIKNHITSNGGQMLIDLNKRYIEHNSLPVHSKNFFKAPFTAKQINDIIKKQDNAISNKFKSIKSYKPTNNTVYSKDLLDRIYNSK